MKSTKELRSWFKQNSGQLSHLSKSERRGVAKWVTDNSDSVVEPAKKKEPKAQTKAFWQGQSFGAASPVRRINPKTGEVIE